ncbi:TetR/AcrR family transcriptional regulator [Rothia halotolerans]|uniref:TetR/AcrR family transcriptional regulator n=1 Tax=Rothia halotolerans TaxID=405770 RepID=UPI0018752379|nr:helix-turn-helix domain-containing protein [Rothia halotolerans]
MALTRERILETALEILSAYGLGDLSMRRLAAELDVAPGALYYHVRNKQELLAQLAHRLLETGPGRPPRAAAAASRPAAPASGTRTAEPEPASPAAEPVLPPGSPPAARRAAEAALERALAVRASLAGIPDAADVVSLAMALRPEAVPPLGAVAAALESAGLAAERAGWAARTVLYTVLGFVGEEQSRAQAAPGTSPAEVGNPSTQVMGASAEACAFGVRAVLRGLFL